MTKILCNVAEAAAMLSIGRSKLYELIALQEISTITIGKRRLVPVESLNCYIASLSQGSVQ